MQIIADTHTHTISSGHAYSTVMENAKVAKSAGLAFMCVTDHASTMPGSPHHWHFVNQRVIPDVLEGVRICRGVEANILDEAGNLDMPLYVYLYMDWVNASLHEPVFRPVSEAVHTNAIVNTIQNGIADAIGHPGNPSFPINIETVVKSAAEHGIALELNNSSFNGSRAGSEPNCVEIAALAKQYGAWVTTGSDAHFANDIGRFESVQALIKQVGLSPDQIITSSEGLFIEFMNKRHMRRQEIVKGLLS
ncbi:phosphatase [Enterovibrio nigricans]|uniref:Putative hydrolase n=1 Tax=Enterovibrio nigricans DSM 22720 TaxID=1121868 RepID=A0A1T4VHQ3_9GAMM|nr:phosphatase [Enterovibrio nigricans]PKF49654.1 phosphatase [Enterovibrio nigricans]SKA64433.1 putative hydrolase [Enterovibrio nigricans DSM 22720]